MGVRDLQTDKRRGGANQRRGKRLETELVGLFRDAGFPGARRQVCSGSLRYIDPRFAADVRTSMVINGVEWLGEAKMRKQGFAQLRRFLDECGGHFVYARQDKESPIVCLSWTNFVQLLQYVPLENRLPPPKDRLQDLKEAARISPIAKQVLERVQQFHEPNPLASMEVPDVDPSTEPPAEGNSPSGVPF